MHRQLPIMAMTCGLGHIGGRSISSMAKELRIRLMKPGEGLDPGNYKIEQVVECSHKFFAEKYNDPANAKIENDSMEFWIGGYGSKSIHSEIWRFEIQAGNVLEPVQLHQETQPHGIFWGGQGVAIARLLFGIDPASVSALERHGLDTATATSSLHAGQKGIGNYGYRSDHARY